MMQSVFPRSSKFGRWFVSLLMIAILILPLPAQEPSYRVKTVVVNVPATVRNKHGQIVRNLTKDDFVLEEDGRPQTIRYFALDADLPVTLGLLIDTSLSQRRVLEDERGASYKFLDQMLRDQKDRAFIIHFDRDSELLADLTSDRGRLEAALQGLHTPDRETRVSSGGGGPWGGGGGNGPYGGGGGRHRGGGGYGQPGTVLYDAAYLASDELMSKQQGRKALIILTDGVDTGSKVTLDRAIEAAQRADTIVYTILYYDAQAYGGSYGSLGGWGGRGGIPIPLPGGHSDGKKVLERISRETGGRLFEVSSKQPIDNVYAQISDELRNQYNLGYSPDSPNDSGYHRIQLRTHDKDQTVQARSGYYRQ